jgi:hypothetical protein
MVSDVQNAVRRSLAPYWRWDAYLPIQILRARCREYDVDIKHLAAFTWMII